MLKKCVIVGGGLGGLSCGIMLAKNGYEVTILEQGSQAGGCLQCFSRGNVVFETGMHYVGSGDSGQILNTLFRYLEIDRKIQLSRLNPQGYDIISFLGQHYPIANGKENFVNHLATFFPHSRTELEAYCQLIKDAVSTQSIHSLTKEVNLSRSAIYQQRSVNEVIGEIISDPVLREVLAGIQPLYAGVKNQTPFIFHALTCDFYDQSAFRIVGGSRKVADALTDTLKHYGGRVMTRKKVVKILCDGVKAIAVETVDGERFEADVVVSSIHPSCTVALADSSLLRPAFLKRMDSLENTIGAFTVYLKFRKNSMKYMNNNFYYYRGDTTWGCEQYDERTWPKSLLYMHTCHENNPQYAESGSIIAYMNFKEMIPWKGTFSGHRGTDYEDFKKQKAEAVLSALEEEFPEIRRQIESYYTSTPLTYLNYTGVPDGAMYGVARNVNLLGGGIVSCKTKIKNLLLTGQSTICHGMLGTIAGGVVTCSEILSEESIFKNLESVRETT